MTPWTPALIERLRQLWAEGRSAPDVAAELGLTEHQIGGKVRRLSLEPRRGDRRPRAGKTATESMPVAEPKPVRHPAVIRDDGFIKPPTMQQLMGRR